MAVDLTTETAARYVAAGQTTIEEHNRRAGYEIDDENHGLVMLLVDLLAYAEKHGIDMNKAVEEARETYLDCLG